MRSSWRIGGGPRAARGTLARGPAVVAAVFVALILALLSSSLIGGKVLTPGDYIYAWPPFSADAPAGYTGPSNRLLTDPVLSFEPDMLQTRRDLQSGTLPLWNPYSAAGHPLLASELPASAFPLTWLAFVLPFWSALGWIAALKLLLAAIGTYLFCRELALRRGPSLLAAVTFAFSLYFVTWLEHTETNVWLALPWLFLAARRTCLTGSLSATALLGASVGIACVGGHPESTLFVLGGTVAYCAFQLAIRWRELGFAAVAPRLGLVAGGIVVGLGVGAIVNVPFGELLGQSGGTHRGNAGMSLNGLYSFFFPEFWGNPAKALSAGGPVNFQERTVYFGALPLLLAVCGLRLRGGREQWFFAVMAAVAVAIAYRVPVIAAAVRKLPGTNVPDLIRILILVVFAGSVLAAQGLHRLLGAPPRERMRMLSAMVVLAVSPPLIWIANRSGYLSHLGQALGQLPSIHHDETNGAVVELASVWRWVLACVIGIGGLALLHRMRSVGVGAIALAIALTGFDLVSLERGYHPSVPQSVANPPAPAAVSYLVAHQGDARVVGSEDALPANLASRYRLRDARIGADLPFTTRYRLLWAGLGGGSGDQETFPGYSPTAQRLADMFAARYVLLVPHEHVPRWLHPVLTTSGGTVAINRTALPRAWVAYDWRQTPSRASALTLTLGSPTAQLEKEPVIEGAPSSPGGVPPPSTVAHVLTDDPEQVSIAANARAKGFLVLDDSAYPGWHATLDGHPVRWLPANDNFRAVALPAGQHIVTFRYKPTSVLVGAIVSAGCVVILLLIAGADPLRRRRSQLKRVA